MTLVMKHDIFQIEKILYTKFKLIFPNASLSNHYLIPRLCHHPARLYRTPCCRAALSQAIVLSMPPTQQLISAAACAPAAAVCAVFASYLAPSAGVHLNSNTRQVSRCEGDVSASKTGAHSSGDSVTRERGGRGVRRKRARTKDSRKEPVNPCEEYNSLKWRLSYASRRFVTSCISMSRVDVWMFVSTINSRCKLVRVTWSLINWVVEAHGTCLYTPNIQKHTTPPPILIQLNVYAQAHVNMYIPQNGLSSRGNTSISRVMPSRLLVRYVLSDVRNFLFLTIHLVR